jgi:hypothetical protein
MRGVINISHRIVVMPGFITTASIIEHISIEYTQIRSFAHYYDTMNNLCIQRIEQEDACI